MNELELQAERKRYNQVAELRQWHEDVKRFLEEARKVESERTTFLASIKRLRVGR